MRAARSWFAHLLALVGIIVWLEAIWPELLSPDLRFFTLTVFGGVLFLVVRTALAEFTSRRKVSRYLGSQRDLSLHKPEALP